MHPLPLPRDTHGCHHRLGGLCPFFFNCLFCLFCLHLLPSSLQPYFQFFSSVLCQTPLSGPSGPASRVLACSHLGVQIRAGETPWPAPGLGLWAVGKILVFNQQAPVGSKGGVGGLPEFLARCPQLPASALCRPQRVDSTWDSFYACHQAPGCLARGQSSPPLTQGQKSNNVQGQEGPWELWEQRLELPREAGVSYLVGNLEGPRDRHCLPVPRAALLTLWTRQEEHFWGSPSAPPAWCLTRASFQLAVPPAGRWAWPWSPPGWGLGSPLLSARGQGPQPRLLHILHRDSVGP